MEREKSTFRMNLESEILVQWSTKVDALMLYVAELEDKIKQEQEAKDMLALMYDQSLTTGYTRLQSETANLSQNPLIHEVTVPYCEVGGHAGATERTNAADLASQERYTEMLNQHHHRQQ